MADWTYVDTPEALAPAVDAMRQATIIGFDTEFVGESTYEPVLCLLQVATETGIWVIDPLNRLDLTAFWEALTAPGRTVVALAARQELLFCLRYAGRLPETVFDPQLAAGLVGFGYPLSHTNMLLKVLDIRVHGGETVTDWRKRPLTPKQLEYSADDVRSLLTLRSELLARADALGRAEWLATECARMTERVVRSLTEERWQRTPGATGLPRRVLAVLRELWAWRDEEARRSDVPQRRVLGDDMLIEVAKRSPKTPEDLLALRGMDRYRRSAHDLVGAVQRALALPDAQLPALLRRDDPPQLSVLSNVLSVVAAGLAAENQVDPALLATSGDLQDLVRWQLNHPGADRPALMDSWRGDILGKPLLDLLNGKSTIRVHDVHARNPLRFDTA